MLTFWFFLLYVVGGLFWAAFLLWFIAAFFLRGKDLSAFDRPEGQRFSSGAQPSAAMQGVLDRLARMQGQLKGSSRLHRTALLRQAFDHLFDDHAIDARIEPVTCAGVPAEWVLASGADPTRRLLYIHGGAYMLGSPRSHRTLTQALSARTGCAVLAIDYRLMPEHRRQAGIDDCRTAYRWLLDNGPEGPQPAQSVFVAGDSAGGNLTLSLIAWVRDAGLRAPNAAVALSPATDSTLASPSLRANAATDAMLGPAFAPLLRLPRTALLWIAGLQNRINPRNPVVSPVNGDLSRLPPVLVQVSGSEMLLDDARRWVNRARAAGSPARLQVWDDMVHVWQLFNPELPQANQALDEAAAFLAEAERGTLT